MAKQTEEEEIEAALDEFLSNGGCGEHKGAATLKKCCVVAFIANTEVEVEMVYPEEMPDEEEEEEEEDEQPDDDEEPEDK